MAKNAIGKVTQIMGAVIDVKFEGDLPNILNALHCENGGKLLVLEFSKPAEAIKPAYDLYSFKVLPLLGKLVANDETSYQYLAESIRMHPDQDTLLNMMEGAGFDRCRYHNLAGGVVALHIGYRL